MPHNNIRIARRFLRSIRIGSDIGVAAALEGFVCTKSTADTLKVFARHVSERKQGAFTWTGPYGSGKSSLVVALSALLNGDPVLRKEATQVFGEFLAKTMWECLPTGTKGWRIIPVVGRRDHPIRVIGEAIEDAGISENPPNNGWNERNLIDALVKAAEFKPKTYGGLLIFIDEMGKFLEASAQDGSDIYVLQEIAEIASRSNGRLIIVGVLHQAFEEYAHRLSRNTRDEWAKVQGRFIDLIVDTAGEEQVDLIGRAIESSHSPEAGDLSKMVARYARRDREAVEIERFAAALEKCWPLHPVVACLLGPISRRRFGQNQRSIFGFLNSAEPNGFQDFLNQATEEELYGPDRLWDYLRVNLEPSILASPDGHRWALTVEAVERGESIGVGPLHLKLLKTIGVLDLFKDRTGLVASFDLLCACFPEISSQDIKAALKKLGEWSFTIFKKFLDAHAIFAGSDFNIEQAILTALDEIDTIDFKLLKQLAGLQPLLAKRHYHETGAMRWFDVNIVPVGEVVRLAHRSQPEKGTVGQFILAIPTENESEEQAWAICRQAVEERMEEDTAVGISKASWVILPLARELFALERVSNNHPELAGDSVARREVNARLASLQAQVETELNKAFDGAHWFRKGHSPVPLRQADLNGVASNFADLRYGKSPRLHNELLNRPKPSSNAIAAQNTLLRKMVLNEGEARLGIEGFPAEGGLFESILEGTGLYQKKGETWRFVSPIPGDPDSFRLYPIWDAALDHIRLHKTRTIPVSELFEIWHQPPFGVKDGLKPVLAVAFILSQKDNLVVYREGIFRAKFDDVDVEYLAKAPNSIQLRWMDLGDISRSLLTGLAEIVRSIDRANPLSNLEPIDVARGLVAIYDHLPAWSKRTSRLSENAIRVREVINKAKDPNKFIFEDIPTALGQDISHATPERLHQVVVSVGDGLDELVNAYPTMLLRLRDIMLSELQVPNVSPQSLAELRERAENIREMSGDFKLEAFVGRLVHFDGQMEAFEGITSLAANKPPRNWVDPDLDAAVIEIADLAQRFLKVETYARVNGRPGKRQAIAVVIGINGRQTPLFEEFTIKESDRPQVDAVIERLANELDGEVPPRKNVILAALAELSTRYMSPDPSLVKSRKRSEES